MLIEIHAIKRRQMQIILSIVILNMRIIKNLLIKVKRNLFKK